LDDASSNTSLFAYIRRSLSRSPKRREGGNELVGEGSEEEEKEEEKEGDGPYDYPRRSMIGSVHYCPSYFSSEEKSPLKESGSSSSSEPSTTQPLSVLPSIE
jgi:hypothetical protein